METVGKETDGSFIGQVVLHLVMTGGNSQHLEDNPLSLQVGHRRAVERGAEEGGYIHHVRPQLRMP